ncbi:hypothetical protein APHAL10511_007985 [Amanita phalloides]|nr:hypothetical protein APHAL10511_007985 [Amanita phalloides]
MKLLGVSLLTVIFATLSAAQKVHIVSPTPGEKFGLGHELTVQIARPASEYAPTEVGLAITTISCGSGPCIPPTQAAGGVLYYGPYNPKSHGKGVAYQNFTVVLPNFQVFIGPAQISVIRLALVGGIPHPILDTTSVPIEVL